MADYNLNAEITADASGYEAGINKAKKASKNLSTTVSSVIKGLGKNGLVGALGAVGLASSGLSATLGSVVKIARKVSETMNECTNAYKNQLIAERALDTAIQNNPFVTGASADALKQFASEMQKVSNYGDEELIPMMTNLISLGRTESETMQIMSVAMDMSAGMGISLDTAITQLNATLNGNIGRLGQQNAELKGLTEEELKQGKAIEILGEKFKGLSSATADTSRQLQNIKGDFKEALGQFTLPSSDMWNTFWAGFYEKGIAVIQKFNDYLDVKIIGKQLVENLYNNARTVAKANKLKVEDVFMDFRYVREELSYLNDSELSTLQKTLERQKERTQGEERILATVKQMLRNKELEADQEKANAEAEAKRAREEEARLAKEKELAEERARKEKELAELRERRAKLQEEWQDKLFAQRIEQLERARDLELENEELTEEQKNEIREFYMQQIVTMKVAQLEKERDEVLKNEELTEEARIAVQNYYSILIQNVKEDEAKKIKKINDEILDNKKKNNKEEEKDEKSKLAKMVEYAKQYAQKIKQVFSKVVSVIKNAFDTVKNFFSKLFEFNIDDALNTILKIEDTILTFFVETLPKMPKFLASVMQSIRVLLRNIKNTVKREDIAKLVFTMFKTISDNLPAMINDLAEIFENLVDGAIDGLVKWLDAGGIETILRLVLKIQTTIERIVTNNLDKIADLLTRHIEDFADFLAESMTRANNTLPELIKAVLEIVVALINAIAKAFENEKFVKSIINSIKNVIMAIVKIIPNLIDSIIKLIVNIITAIVPYLPDLIMQLIREIAMALPSMAGQISKSLSEGITKIFKKIFTSDFWLDVLASFPTVLDALLRGALSFGGGSSSGGGGSSGGSSYVGQGTIFDPNPQSNPVTSWLFGHAKGTNNAQRGLALVGEAGPELVRFRGGEQVLNNRNTNKALAGMGGNTNNFNVTFNNLQDTTAFNMMQQLKAYNRQMAINSII